MMPNQYLRSKFCYAFDQEKWISRQPGRGPEFYEMIDHCDLFNYLKDFLIDEPKAVVFWYATGNGLFTGLPLYGCDAKEGR